MIAVGSHDSFTIHLSKAVATKTKVARFVFAAIGQVRMFGLTLL